jgi:hypothetical protein
MRLTHWNVDGGVLRKGIPGDFRKPYSNGLVPSRCSLPPISWQDCYRYPGWAAASCLLEVGWK